MPLASLSRDSWLRLDCRSRAVDPRGVGCSEDDDNGRGSEDDEEEAGRPRCVGAPSDIASLESPRVATTLFPPSPAKCPAAPSSSRDRDGGWLLVSRDRPSVESRLLPPAVIKLSSTGGDEEGRSSWCADVTLLFETEDMLFGCLICASISPRRPWTTAPGTSAPCAFNTSESTECGVAPRCCSLPP